MTDSDQFFPGEAKVREYVRAGVHENYPGKFTEREIDDIRLVMFDLFLTDPLFKPLFAFDYAVRKSGHHGAYGRDGDIGKHYHRTFYALLAQIIELKEQVDSLTAQLAEKP